MIRQKGGGRSGVQRTPRFGAREQRIRSDEDTALSKLSPKIQNRLPRSLWCDRRALGRHLVLPHDEPGSSSPQTRKAISSRRSNRLHTTQRSVADVLRLKFFFFVCPLRGAVSLTSWEFTSNYSRLNLRLEGICWLPDGIPKHHKLLVLQPLLSLHLQPSITHLRQKAETTCLSYCFIVVEFQRSQRETDWAPEWGRGSLSIRAHTPAIKALNSHDCRQKRTGIEKIVARNSRDFLSFLVVFLCTGCVQ